MDLQLQLEAAFLLVILILTRILYLIHKITTGHSRKSTKTRTTPCKTLICIGSGGHTTEMLRLISNLDLNKYSPRSYIIAKSDTTSLNLISKFEEESSTKTPYHIIKIPRSRHVGQSYVTSLFTTLWSILYSIPFVITGRPDLILCNGPGTCIPICLVAFIMKVAFICETRIVFVESFCRSETFSLSGKILIYFADNFIVQWPHLKKKLKRAEYIGQLM